jgi:hypothetical protein
MPSNVLSAEQTYTIGARGLNPNPGFAHNAHVARQDCDLYHPSFGVEDPGSWGEAPAAEPISEIDLCLDDRLDDKGTWSLFLRFPEISDLGNARLRALVTGSVSVVTGSSSMSISLMDLRPGVGSARLVVPPSMNTYEASPAGQWPTDFSSDRWTGTCEGLNPRGTPFVLRKGEWERLRDGGELQLGSEIRIVADVRNAPPPVCSVEALAIKPHSKLEWRGWRVFLPDSISTSLDRWAEAINVTHASPADEIALLGVPQGFDSNSPVFTTGHSLIAKIKWVAGEPSAALSLGTPLGGESTSTWPTQTSPAYMAFEAQDSGSTTLTANYECELRTRKHMNAITSSNPPALMLGWGRDGAKDVDSLAESLSNGANTCSVNLSVSQLNSTGAGTETIVLVKVMRPHINRPKLQHPDSRCLYRNHTVLILERAFHKEKLSPCHSHAVLLIHLGVNNRV